MIRSTEDTPMTVGERYASALGSSNLRMQERRSDLDVIIAAGWLQDGFAAALIRLRLEYDLIRGEHLIADTQLRNSERYAGRQKDEIGKDGKAIPGRPGADGLPTTAAERSDQILKDAERAATAAHAMILLSMTTLPLAKEMMGHFTLREAKARKFNEPIKDLFALAGQVLDVHISPTCRHCAGRGFNGNLQKGENQAPCRPCFGSGTRRDMLGKNVAARLFASHLLMTMDALVCEAERILANKRRLARERKALITNAEAEAGRG